MLRRPDPGLSRPARNRARRRPAPSASERAVVEGLPDGELGPCERARRDPGPGRGRPGCPQGRRARNPDLPLAPVTRIVTPGGRRSRPRGCCAGSRPRGARASAAAPSRRRPGADRLGDRGEVVRESSARASARRAAAAASWRRITASWIPSAIPIRRRFFVARASVSCQRTSMPATSSSVPAAAAARASATIRSSAGCRRRRRGARPRRRSRLRSPAGTPRGPPATRHAGSRARRARRRGSTPRASRRTAPALARADLDEPTASSERSASRSVGRPTPNSSHSGARREAGPRGGSRDGEDGLSQLREARRRRSDALDLPKGRVGFTGGHGLWFTIRPAAPGCDADVEALRCVWFDHSL